MPAMADESTRQLAEDLLHGAPAGAIAPSIAQSLLKPTPRVLHDAATALLSSGHLDAAEPVFRGLLERLNFGVRAAIGLARIAEKRADPQAASATWRECLKRFPGDAKPFWYIGLARAARELGNGADAEASLRKCVERFPKFAPAAANLASALASMGRPSEAVEVWRTALRDGSDQVQPWWILEYAAALRSAGHGDLPDDVLDAGLSRLPDDPTMLAFQARRAAGEENWGAALDFWTRCLDRQPATGEPEWLTGQAMALFRLWRAEEAMEVWQDLTKLYPDFVAGYSDMASAAAELGRWEIAGQCWSRAIERFPERTGPEWIARRAMCSLYRWPDKSLDAAIAELDMRFPESPVGRHMAIRLANRCNLGLRALETLVEDAVGRFPADREILAQKVRVLLAHQRLADAEAVVQRLEADEEDHHALISRWRLVTDRDGEESIVESVHRASSGHSRPVSQVLEIGEFLLSVSSPWSLKQALVVFNDLEKRCPGRVTVAVAKARTLISLRQDQAALDLIESLPQLYQSQDVMELRAWACARRGDVDDARRIWESILARYYFRAVHSPQPSLEPVFRPVTETQCKGVTAFVPVRDELAQLPEFLRHHRRLGVRRFVVVDNMSTDGSDAYLLAQPDVMLYRTADNFQDANCGMRWINALIERHGAGGWCLFIDADEAFVYPAWESIPLSRLIEYLDQEGAEAVSAFMLDVYPERLSDSEGAPVTHGDCRYYDGDYEWIGHVRPPYRRPLGGVRSRLFGVKEYLQKVPLIKSGRGIYIDNHATTAVRFASVTGALLHYKMIGLRAKRDTAPANKEGNPFVTDLGLETMRRYEQYASHLTALSNVDLRASEASQPLTDSLTLASRGLMRSPAKFLRWMGEHLPEGERHRDGLEPARE